MRILLLSFFLALPSVAADDSLTLVVDGKEKSWTLPELRKALKVITVTLDDPVYGKKKSFDGFRLKDLLQLGGQGAASEGDEVVFTAKDGYSPNVSIQTIRDHAALVAFQEHGTKLHFGKVAQGKHLVSPAPFYVLWDEGKPLAETAPWPYQLARIEVVSFARKYDQIYPKGVPATGGVMKGFLTFKAQCIRCHSLNLQGGDLGPELNSPLNVTEYWDRAVLRRFIRDASSFRYKDKMPSFPHLKEEELDQLFEYFSYMKDHKLSAPPAK